ncbi:MAG: ParB N-terminal domain-containing protein, partial [Deltaproteobacteria bacterium]|nr:ParB N-terminal domain-containing protein [Deltaproteobacteria bacterium]
ELGALIGIGRGNPNEDPDRLSAHPDTAANLMKLLQSDKKRKIIAAEASQGRGRGGYAGWNTGNLNQLFTDENENDPNVQSIQIEIKMTGYRNDAQVPNTAIIFADAFEKMDNFKPIKEHSFWPALAKKCEVKEISTGEIDLSDEKFKFRIEDYGINQEKLDRLIKSIKANEILNNIIVRKSGDKEEYQLISGFRRLSALEKICEERGEDFSNAKIWAKVFTKLSDEEAYNISFAENLAREDLSIWEIANSCKAISDDLQKAGKSKSDIEKHLVELMQKGDRTVRRYLHVSTIQNKEIRKEIHNGNLDFTTAELFAKKEFDEEDRVELHQFYKKHPMSSRELEQFTRNLLALRDWADLKIKKILSFPRAAIFLKIDPEQLKNNVEYLNKQTSKPVNHILERNIGFLKDSLSGIEAKFAKKPFLKKFSKRSKALESKIGKVFDTQKVGANLSIKPAGDVEDEMVKVVISAPASNIQKAIKLMDKEIGKDFAGLGGLSGQRDKKHAFTYDGKTGIAESKEFKKKLLADLSCNIGCICEFGCTFCYVPTITTKLKYVQAVLKEDYKIDEISLYRSKDNVLNTVNRDLIKIQPGDNREVIFCTTCDPCATEEHADITTSAIKLIMESSDLQVRVLSKSVLIMDIASELEGFRDRITYSLSTGTIRPEISACIEGNASPIEERIKTLNQLQADGFRTYGMLCPILPSEMDKLDILIDKINPKVCEHVWAEAINVRGKSLVETREQLIECGLTEDAEAIGDVMGNKESWRNYSKELFLNLQAKMKKRELLHKFRFLQYVKKEPTEFKKFFGNQEGAVCL